MSPTDAAAAQQPRPPAASPAGSRRLVTLLVVLLLVGLTALSWVLYQRWGVRDVTARVRTFSVLSDSTVRVVFEVTPKDRQPAYCLVRARDETGAETGRQIVEVPAPPPDERTVVHRHDLATRDRAVTGEVPTCSLSPPAGSAAASAACAHGGRRAA